MRLSTSQKQGILETLKPYLMGAGAAIYLFGSRVDDKKRGGDIDLLILTEGPKLAKTLLAQKHFILAAIKGKVGEQKIDLFIRSKMDLNTDFFLQDILKHAVRL